jgi:hypothetical protein
MEILNISSFTVDLKAGLYTTFKGNRQVKKIVKFSLSEP